MASTRHDDSVSILLNYESNLNDTIQKDNRAMKSIETQIKNNQSYIEKMENSTRKLSAQSQKLLEKRREENSLLEKKLQLLQKESSTNNQLNANFEKYFQQMVRHLNTIAKSNEQILTGRKKTLDTEKEITKELEKQDKAKSKRGVESKQSFLSAFDSEQATSFSHKVGTTAQYIAAGAAIMGVAATFSALAKSAFEAELSMRTMAAVLELGIGQAIELSRNVRELGEVYGGSTEEIDNVALALGRAGIKSEDLVTSTKIVLQMARLTGDTFEQSSNAIISFQQVFGDTTSIERLGDKLAYIANVSRLSTHDIGTFANYALAAAKNVGLTEDAVGGLAAAFSNAGVNASTIGTQIRRFTTLLTDDSGAVTSFFEGIGVNQKNLMLNLQSDTETSNKAIIDFANRLNALDDIEFANLIGGMDILAANSLQLMRNNADNIEKFVKDLQDNVEGQLKNTEDILDAYIVKFEALWNKIKNLGADIVQSETFNDITYMFDSLTFGFFDDKATNQMKALAHVRTQMSRDLAELQTQYNEGKISEADYIGKTIQLETKLLDIKKDAEKLRPELKERTDAEKLQILKNQLDIRQRMLERPIDQDGNMLPPTTIEAMANGYMKVADAVATLEKNLDKVGKLPAVAQVKGAQIEDVAKDLRSKIGVGTVTSEDLEFLDDVYKRAVDTIKSKRAKALEDIQDINTKSLIESARLGGKKGLQEAAVKVQTDAERETDLTKRKALIETQNLLEKEIDFENTLLEKEQTRNSVLKSLKASQKESTNEQIKYSREALEGYILENKLKGVQFDKISLLKLEIADRENYLKTQKQELITQSDTNELLRIKLQLRDEEELQAKKTLKINAEIQRKELEFRLKLDELQRKDYTGVGRSRADTVKDIRNRLQLLADNKIEAEKDPDLVKRKEALDKIALETYETTRELEVEQNRLNNAISTGAVDALNEYANKAQDVYSQVRDTVTSALSTMEDAIVQFTTTGKFSFTDMANSILQDILRMQIRAQILGPVMQGIGMMFGTPAQGSWLTNNPAVANGAISYNATGGQLPRSNFMSGGLLVGGSGFKDDIYLGKVGNTQAFAMGGEYITRQSSVNSNTRDTLEYINKTGQVPATSTQPMVNVPVKINIENKTGQDISADMMEAFTKPNEKGEYEKVVNIVLKASQTDPRMRALLKGR